MGTRADFYIGRGENAEWIGSTAWDGYPDGIQITTGEKEKVAPGIVFKIRDRFPQGEHLFDATTETQFRERLARYFKNREDVTYPGDGWPWPWDDSRTTDYSYAFDCGSVWASCFGHTWFDPRNPAPEEDSPKQVFPDMKAIKAVTLGPRSGVIVIQG